MYFLFKTVLLSNFRATQERFVKRLKVRRSFFPLLNIHYLKKGIRNVFIVNNKQKFRSYVDSGDWDNILNLGQIP